MVSLPFLKKNNDIPGETGRVDGSSIIELRNVQKSYKTAVGDYPALKGIELNINAGEFVSIIGKSGSGKTTLINMITGIDRPTSGEVWVNNTAVHKLSEIRWRVGAAETSGSFSSSSSCCQ